MRSFYSKPFFAIMILFFVSILAVTFSQQSVYGLSCAPINMTKSVEETQIIFSGKVISTEKYAPSLQSSFNIVTSFDITENFKGINEQTIKVFSDETWGPFFEESLEYLVFADKVDDKIHVQLCSPTDRVGNSEIKLVRKLTDNNSIPLTPKIELKIVPEKVRYGESLIYYYSLPSYDRPNAEQYIHKVINPDGVTIDSTLWFARQDSEYEFRTNHFLYNITSGGTFSIIFEKAELLQPTGDIVKTSFFEITTNPSPLTQFERGVSANNVSCNQGLDLILKYDGIPACVKPETIPKLIERGWAIMISGRTSDTNLVTEYCQYSKQKGLPTPWEYHCYDEPLGNPQREMNLGKSAIIINYKDCNVDDKLSCFEESFDDVCTPTTFTHVNKTVEGDSIFIDVFLKEDCVIHVVHDNRLDMYSSLDTRRITHTVCPNIELVNNHIVLDSCNELQPFDDYYELFHIKKEKNNS